MTPQEASEIFWKAYEGYSRETQFDLKRLKQSELYQAGFKALIDAFNKESDTEWAKRYLAIQETNKHLTYKFTNEEIQGQETA
jgi:hypothetical protein